MYLTLPTIFVIRVRRTMALAISDYEGEKESGNRDIFIFPRRICIHRSSS